LLQIIQFKLQFSWQVDNSDALQWPADFHFAGVSKLPVRHSHKQNKIRIRGFGLNSLLNKPVRPVRTSNFIRHIFIYSAPLLIKILT